MFCIYYGHMFPVSPLKSTEVLNSLRIHFCVLKNTLKAVTMNGFLSKMYTHCEKETLAADGSGSQGNLYLSRHPLQWQPGKKPLDEIYEVLKIVKSFEFSTRQHAGGECFSEILQRVIVSA